MTKTDTKKEHIDRWRKDFRCYAAQWGFRCGSEIAKLIGFIRDEYRAKYGTNYRLRRCGKNRFLAVPGDHSDYGVSYAIEAAQRFNTSVTRGPVKTDNKSVAALKKHEEEA